MNNATKFKKAHEIARNTVRLVGNYAIAFSLALKGIWASIAKVSDEAKLLASGGKIWQGGTHKRIYLSVELFANLFNIEFSELVTREITMDATDRKRFSKSSTYFDCNSQSVKTNCHHVSNFIELMA